MCVYVVHSAILSLLLLFQTFNNKRKLVRIKVNLVFNVKREITEVILPVVNKRVLSP